MPVVFVLGPNFIDFCNVGRVRALAAQQDLVSYAEEDAILLKRAFRRHGSSRGASSLNRSQSVSSGLFVELHPAATQLRLKHYEL
jgi:hypothetical protein